MQDTRVRRSPFPQPGGGAGGGGAFPGAPTPAPSLGPAPVLKPPGPQATPANNFDFDSWEQPQPVFHPSSQPVQPPTQPMQGGMPPQPYGQAPAMQGQPPAGPYGGPAGGSNANQAFAGAVAGAFANSMGVDQNMMQGMAGLVANQAQAHVQNSGMGGVMAWFPGMFLSLRLLFAVGHSFVLRKLVFLMCPFVKKAESAPSGFGNTPWGDASPGPGCDSNSMRLGPDGLKVDIEEPDGYIPLMSFTTYLIAYSFQRGLTSDFKPEVIYSTFSFAVLLLLLEIGAAKLTFYLAGSPVPLLDILMICTYKYVPVVLMVLFRILTAGSKIYYVFFVYLAACAAWSVRRSMLHFEPEQVKQQYGVQPSRLHQHAILGIAAAQVPVCWLLTPSASS